MLYSEVKRKPVSPQQAHTMSTYSPAISSPNSTLSNCHGFNPENAGFAASNSNNRKASPTVILSEGGQGSQEYKTCGPNTMLMTMLSLCELVGQQQQQPSQDMAFLTEHCLG